VTKKKRRWENGGGKVRPRYRETGYGRSRVREEGMGCQRMERRWKRPITKCKRMGLAIKDQTGSFIKGVKAAVGNRKERLKKSSLNGTNPCSSRKRNVLVLGNLKMSPKVKKCQEKSTLGHLGHRKRFSREDAGLVVGLLKMGRKSWENRLCVEG